MNRFRSTDHTKNVRQISTKYLFGPCSIKCIERKSGRAKGGGVCLEVVQQANRQAEK